MVLLIQFMLIQMIKDLQMFLILIGDEVEQLQKM